MPDPIILEGASSSPVLAKLSDDPQRGNSVAPGPPKHTVTPRVGDFTRIVITVRGQTKCDVDITGQPEWRIEVG